MITERMRVKRIWIFGIASGVSFLSLVFFLFGRPSTPMTLKDADQLFNNVSVAGNSREAVQAWLSSQRILSDILERREDTTFKGWWMDCVGHRTVAECAGLNIDDVYSVIRVSYPDSKRYFWGHAGITVYFFFDAKGLFLRRWANEYYESL
jgi:hypothetical protein